MRYIHQLDIWPKLRWSHDEIASALGAVRNRQGRLMGRMEAIGFPLRLEAVLQTLTLDVLKSSEIEGEFLDHGQVRSSIARRLEMDIAGLIPSDPKMDGVVEVMLDATQNFDKPLTKERLFGWHAKLFSAEHSGMHKIVVGAWRNETQGPMRIVSGTVGRQRVHFEAPDAERLEDEMKVFLNWFNGSADMDPVVKAAIAHLWFMTLHPFEEGNGRIARAITDMQLARSDGSRERFYSLSAHIRQERSIYYDVLEKTQKNSHVTKNGIDITPWLTWFLVCLNRALDTTENTLADVFKKARFGQSHLVGAMNERQRMMINKLLDGVEGKLTSSNWAKIAKCSHDTALRDILDLVEKGILIKDFAGGRSTSYLLKD